MQDAPHFNGGEMQVHFNSDELDFLGTFLQEYEAEWKDHVYGFMGIDLTRSKSDEWAADISSRISAAYVMNFATTYLRSEQL